MEQLPPANFSDPAQWDGWQRALLILLCFASVILLGEVRTATDAELAFASLALIPVLAIAWVGGLWPGLCMATMAATMWAISDISSGRPFSANWIPWLNAVVRLFTYALVVMLVTRIRTQLINERALATTDALTGLKNRRSLMAWGISETQRAVRYGNAMTVAYLDLDAFKVLNDTQGHTQGDAALKATASAIKDSTRESDFVARLGGDEFVIIFPQLDCVSAVAASEKVFAMVSLALKDFPPTGASMGMAWFEQAGPSFETMLQCSDALMYSAKSAGRNSLVYRCYTATEPNSSPTQGISHRPP
jgi:diguanylate cyclase (GGDEF)-like protein